MVLNFIGIFADLVGRVLQERCSHVLEGWNDDTGTETGEETACPGQRAECPPQQHAGRSLRQVPQEQSVVLPTQLGGFPSKTIEFGNHLVYQRAALHKQNGVTSVVIFLDMTAAFYRALPELVLGPLLADDDARAVLMGAPSSGMDVSDCASRTKAALLDWGAPPLLHRAIADWHADTFFQVRHSERTYGLVSGVRPGI